MATITQVSDLEQILGEETTALLQHQCKTIPKEQLHLPGPDAVDRMFASTDRPTRVLSSVQALLSHGRLAGTGYLPLSAIGATPAAGFGDDTLATFTVPSYLFGSEPYTRLGVSSNGYLVVGGQTASADNDCCNPQHFPNSAKPNNTQPVGMPLRASVQ